MPAFLFVLIARLVTEVRKQMRIARTTKPRPLCTDCTHAHVQYAVNGRRAIACTFAGAVRPVVIDVMYCTDYRDRDGAPRPLPMGFIREIAEAEAIADPAIAS
jgi:hypothetical protein